MCLYTASRFGEVGGAAQTVPLASFGDQPAQRQQSFVCSCKWNAVVPAKVMQRETHTELLWLSQCAQQQQLLGVGSVFGKP